MSAFGIPPANEVWHCEWRGCTSNRATNGPGTRPWRCVDCGCLLCDICWDLVIAHQNGRVGREGIAHEKTDPSIQRVLQDILRPQFTAEQLDSLHEDDEETTWFGIGREEHGRPFLTDGGIYQSLMTRCSNGDKVKHPRLVSFVGQTEAGKSTLIKMLIKLEECRNNPLSTSTFPSPVVGPRIGAIPTSADVHLYPDPLTFNTPAPLLYADCEGLDAGDVPPRATTFRRSRRDVRREIISGGRKRYLEWADTDEKRSRRFTVAELYPRLLYTFSDVVVFVLKNARTFQETVLERLLKWGQASLETSINQPTLPHVIVALNAADFNVSDEEWDENNATANLLNAVRNSWYRRPSISDLAETWRRRGRIIRTISDLIHCYYSSFTVVRIPVEGRYNLLKDQLDKLSANITNCCEASFRGKRRARMLLNSDELGMFLQSAFDHFSQDLENPFNFIEVSLRNNPIPKDFGGNVLQLAIAVQQADRNTYGEWIFGRLSYVVASSVLLDCVRNRKGLPQDHFGEYKQYFENTLKMFCRMYSPCQFRNSRGVCVNTSAMHRKGHQNAKGKIIGSGPYRSDFTFKRHYQEWINYLQEDLQSAQNTLLEDRERTGHETSDEKLVLRQHIKQLAKFYQSMGPTRNFKSHTVCFSCFIEMPQHVLPCSHVLCTSCIKGYGTRVNKFDFRIKSCPLHSDQPSWGDPFVVRFKPDFAGIRILSLDGGGGVRGIVELEVLNAIQNSLGRKIPIRAFFDLIVGTSSSGFIAIALGLTDWPISECIDKFRKLYERAFAPREFHSIPLLQKAITTHHGSVYKTKPLYTALKQVLGPVGERQLFGGSRENDPSYVAKVALTSTDEAGKRAVVIANYNRNGDKGLEDSQKRTSAYEFPRPSNPSNELTYWEAAAATSATPPYFKPFFHQSSHRYFWDGSLNNSNPAKIAHRERKLLWPDVANMVPDIFLSIGTSQHKSNVDSRMLEIPRRSVSHRRSRAALGAVKSEWAEFPKKQEIGKAATSRMESILDAELTWREFIDLVANDAAVEHERYIRINPDIKNEPPKLDSSGQLGSLQATTKKVLKKSRATADINRIACRLVATSFYYYSTSKPILESGDIYTITGSIGCKFQDGSKEMRDFGESFKLRCTTTFQPYFVVVDSAQTELYRSDIALNLIRNMVRRGAFNFHEFPLRLARATQVTLSLCLAEPSTTNDHTFSISGFPRPIVTDELSKNWTNPESVVTPDGPTHPSYSSQFQTSSFTDTFPLSSPAIPQNRGQGSFTYPQPLTTQAYELPARRESAELPTAETRRSRGQATGRPSSTFSENYAELEASIDIAELPADGHWRQHDATNSERNDILRDTIEPPTVESDNRRVEFRIDEQGSRSIHNSARNRSTSRQAPQRQSRTLNESSDSDRRRRSVRRGSMPSPERGHPISSHHRSHTTARETEETPQRVDLDQHINMARRRRRRRSSETSQSHRMSQGSSDSAAEVPTEIPRGTPAGSHPSSAHRGRPSGKDRRYPPMAYRPPAQPATRSPARDSARSLRSRPTSSDSSVHSAWNIARESSTDRSRDWQESQTLQASSSFPEGSSSIHGRRRSSPSEYPSLRLERRRAT